MYVTNIELSNFKTIENYKGEFSGGIYLVTGENEIGKSTLINAIGTLLTGQRTDNLLKQGKEKGFAKMTVGEGENSYEVELRFTEKNPRGTLSVKKKNSSLQSNKLTALQSIFKYQDFDANEFVKWSETAEGRRKQVDAVKSLLPEEVQKRLKQIDIDISIIKENRKEVNADLRSYNSLLDKSEVSPDDVAKYKEPIELKDLIDKKANALKLEEKMAGVKERYDERKVKIENHDKEVADFDKQIEERAYRFEEEKAEAKKKYDEEMASIENGIKKMKIQAKDEKLHFKNELTKMVDEQKLAEDWIREQEVVDVKKVEQEIEDAELHNQKHNRVKQFLSNQKTLDEVKSKKDKMEADIDGLITEKADIIDKSNLPVKGLDFSEDGLTLKGVPFRSGEVSTSQEMEVAAKLIMAKNPTVKVFRIAQGESLGSKRFEAIVKFAKDNGYQGFIEEVHRGQDELIVEEYKEK